MFGIISDFVEATVDTVADTVDYALGEGEGPTRANVKKMVSSGLSIYVIALAFGVGVDIIEDLIED